MTSIIEGIASQMTLNQKVQWGVDTCKLLTPYISSYYKKQHRADIAVGEAWLSGERYISLGFFNKKKKIKKINEYSWGVGSDSGVGISTSSYVGGVGSRVGIASGSVSIGSGIGSGVVGGVVDVGSTYDGFNVIELLSTTISNGIEILLKDKTPQEKKTILNSFLGMEGFTNLTYLELCMRLKENSTDEVGF